MTILDIAKQGDLAFEGPVTYAFCANCEVSFRREERFCFCLWRSLISACLFLSLTHSFWLSVFFVSLTLLSDCDSGAHKALQALWVLLHWFWPPLHVALSLRGLQQPSPLCPLLPLSCSGPPCLCQRGYYLWVYIFFPKLFAYFHDLWICVFILLCAGFSTVAESISPLAMAHVSIYASTYSVSPERGEWSVISCCMYIYRLLLSLSSGCCSSWFVIFSPESSLL